MDSHQALGSPTLRGVDHPPPKLLRIGAERGIGLSQPRFVFGHRVKGRRIAHIVSDALGARCGNIGPDIIDHKMRKAVAQAAGRQGYSQKSTHRGAYPAQPVDAVAVEHGRGHVAIGGKGIVGRPSAGPGGQPPTERIWTQNEVAIRKRSGRLVEIPAGAGQPVPHDQRRVVPIPPFGDVHFKAGGIEIGRAGRHLRLPLPISVPAMPEGKK